MRTSTTQLVDFSYPTMQIDGYERKWYRFGMPSRRIPPTVDSPSRAVIDVRAERAKEDGRESLESFSVLAPTSTPASTPSILATLPPPRVPGAPLNLEEARHLIEDFWRSLLPVTRVGYRSDLRQFCAFMQACDLNAAVCAITTLGIGRANSLALRWRDELASEGKAPASVNRHLASLRSLLKLARRLGYIEWTLDVQNLKRESRRDMSGPPIEVLPALLQAAADQDDLVMALRDIALVRLLLDRGLRRVEACETNIEHLELREKSSFIWVREKGKRERCKVDLADETANALADWLSEHPGSQSPKAPLFVGLRGPKRGGRLSGRQVAVILQGLAKRAGINHPVRPHGLRHAAITRALDLSGGDLRRAQAFSRHKNLDMLRIYDDRRKELGKEMAQLVALPAKRGG